MEFISKHKRLFLSLGMIICVTAIFFTANESFRPTFVEKALAYTVVPVQQGFTAASRWVADKFNGFADTNRLMIENEALMQEIGQLRIDNQRLQVLDEENKKLSALLSIAQKYAELPTAGAEIIGKDPTDWYDSFNISMGTDSGVSRNMPVLGDGGLVGVIKEVFPNSSKVISIIDYRCKVAVRCKRTEDRGIVMGDARLMQEGLCRMDYIKADAQLMPGDEIETSPHSSIFPPGVLVGTVLRVEPNPDGLTKYAVIQPVAQIDDIETVLVVTKLYGDEDAAFVEPVFMED